MKSEPSIEELLQAVIEFIANSVIPKLEGHDKFHAHVAKNTLGIVLREIMLLRDYDEKEVARLKNILSKDDNIKELNKLLSEKIRSISSGQGDAILGAISTNENQKKIIQHIENARETSEIISGKADIGLFIPPTLIVNPPSTAQILHEETFGPVMTVHPFKTDHDAIKLANMTGYGLSASIFGKNKKRIKFIAKNIKAGTVSINDVLTHYGIADLPFGGIGMSGLGKVHGQEGLRAFSRQKSYLSNRISFKSEFWWFNKRESFGKLIRKWIKWQYS